MITRKERTEEAASANTCAAAGKHVKLDGAVQAAARARAPLFSVLTLIPGASIGYHVHENETELFYFIDGCGRVQDDDQLLRRHRRRFHGDVHRPWARRGEHGRSRFGDPRGDHQGLIQMKRRPAKRLQPRRALFLIQLGNRFRKLFPRFIHRVERFLCLFVFARDFLRRVR